MAKKLEERIEAVRQAASEPHSADAKALLKRAFQGKHGYLISQAAAAIENGAADLVPLATEAFARLLEDPIKRDPQCHGKVAIARVLYATDHTAPEVFERGVAHVQHEPVFGGRQDTAAELRGVCLMALIAQLHPHAWTHAAARLADPERAARLAAVRAIDAGGRPDIAEPLLRLAVEVEDDPEISVDLLSNLIRLDASHLALAQTRLSGRDAALADAAALAVGASRPPGALQVLIASLDASIERERRQACLTGIALLRTDAAWQHLIELIMDAERPLAELAIEALASFRDHPDLPQRVEDAVEDRGNDALRQTFEQAFKTS